MYLFSGSYKKFFSIIAKELDAAGLKPYKTGYLEENDSPPEYVDLLFTMVIEEPQPHIAKNTYAIKCKWQNSYEETSKKTIADKVILHKNLKHTTIVMPSFNINVFLYPGRKWIARPAGVGYHSGKGIKYIHDVASFHQAGLYYGDNPHVIVSEVMRHPILYNGRKMHLRLYMFVYNGKAWMSPVGEIYLAKKQYVEDNWDDPDIHDSHFASTGKAYIYPNDFPEQIYLPTIEMQLRQIEVEISKLTKDFKPFTTAQNGFELFAVDIMIQNAGYVRILEINSKIGLPVDESTPSIEPLAKWVAGHIKEIVAV